MNIGAYMAACEVTDLDRDAKDALRSVCCRADYPDGVAQVPVARIAADMKVHYDTARRALARAVDKGYLITEKSVGKSLRWQINLAVLHREHLAAQDRELVRGDLAAYTANTSRPRTATKDLWNEKEGAAAPPSPGGRAGDNSPRHPATCECQGTGWVFVDNSTVTACRSVGTRNST